MHRLERGIFNLGIYLHQTTHLVFHFLGGWEWADGTPVDYVYWENGEPNGLERGENCAEMYDERYGKWNDEDCLAGAGYICSLKQCKFDKIQIFVK